MKIHGQIGEGDYSHCRWCEVCGHYHGLLLNCEHYPKDIRIEIEQKRKNFAMNLQNSEWVKKQLQNGIPIEVVIINRIFARINT